jgi:hypothetical protein
LLGELIAQQNGILHNFAFDRPLMERLRINDAPRRGSGEGADGWKSAPASNGQVDS